MRMEYKAKPWEHGIMLAWSGIWYGAFAAVLIGLIVRVCAWLAWLWRSPDPSNLNRRSIND